MLIKNANCVAAIALIERPIHSERLADITNEPITDNNINIKEPIYKLEIWPLKINTEIIVRAIISWDIMIIL